MCGEWKQTKQMEKIVDPMNGEVFLNMPATQTSELEPFVNSMTSCPKHGLHNPFKNVERYVFLHMIVCLTSSHRLWIVLGICCMEKYPTKLVLC